MGSETVRSNHLSMISSRSWPEQAFNHDYWGRGALFTQTVTAAMILNRPLKTLSLPVSRI